ncbi:MAG: (5-formylfuran-3-yl)methyl phosphate synthase [Methyloceanibacter sp.]
MADASSLPSPGLAGRSLFLASVRDAAEAEIARLAGADIIDLKEPSQGALGAVDPETTKTIVAALAGRAVISATIGDLPMQPQAIGDAVLERSRLGVDFVKIGLFADGDARACLDALRPLARRVRLILVIFADRRPAFDPAAAAASLGAFGIMLDTVNKSSGSLRHHVTPAELAGFVASAKAHGLTAGLAGSLTREDVPDLLRLRPDLLGFRGALCHGARNSTLDPVACAGVRALIPDADPAPGLRPKAELPEAIAPALC